MKPLPFPSLAFIPETNGGRPIEIVVNFGVFAGRAASPAEIDRLGCFKYEPVKGAPANALGPIVPDEVKQERWNALMARQQKISARRLKRKVGTRQQVIIDEVGPTVSKGRSKADAPEIDGAVYLSSRRPLKVGEIVTAKIERADEYDLHGSVAGF